MTLFGTDGIRAPFGRPPLDRATVVALGAELAAMLGEDGADPVVVVAGDTRASTPTLWGWLAAGLAAGGAGARLAGVLPTPGVAWLVRELGAAAGVAVSASHNPASDNGIKLFGGDGFKWPVERERALEERLARASAGRAAPADPVPANPDLASPDPASRPTGVDDRPPVGLEVEPALAGRYLAGLLEAGGNRRLEGLRVVVDSAHGAAAGRAAELLRQLGAEVVSLFDRPDGANINRGCGSTHPQEMARAVRRHGAACGVAFDGDADRALFADETGEVRDGDALLYLWARGLKSEGRLDPPAVVATTMSNLGLERALAADGIAVERCGVGDREVVAAMLRTGIRLGGEQSGHLVHLDLSTTGDGLLTALEVARRVAAAGRPLSRLLDGFRRYPQVLRNVRVASKPQLLGLPRVAAAARAAEERLGDRGRLVLRYSGTEPLARVMLEGPDQAEIEALAAEILEAIRAEVGEPQPAGTGERPR